MAFGYNYGGYPAPGYYAPPMPDQLSQLRANPYQANNMMQGPQQPVQPATASQPVSNGINWCQGEEGAKAWMVAPGNTVMLMDSDGSSFYLKSADASGMPQPLRIFDYKERTTATKTDSDTHMNPGVEYVTRSDFDALAARYEALEAEFVELKNKPCNCKKKKEDAE